MNPVFHQPSSFQLPTAAVAGRRSGGVADAELRHFLGLSGKSLHICSIKPCTRCVMMTCRVSWIIKCHHRTRGSAIRYSPPFLTALCDFAGRSVRSFGMPACSAQELLRIWKQGETIKPSVSRNQSTGFLYWWYFLPIHFHVHKLLWHFQTPEPKIPGYSFPSDEDKRLFHVTTLDLLNLPNWINVRILFMLKVQDAY